MENTVSVVAGTLAEVTDLAVGLVDQDEGLLLAGYDVAGESLWTLSQCAPPWPGATS